MIGTIPEEIQTFCKKEIGELTRFRAASGGCINNGGLVETTNGQAFVKWNSASRFPGMFTVEAKGLDLLRSASDLNVPKVLSVHEGKAHSGLLLEFIEPGPRAKDFWEVFGSRLANMHKASSDYYGLDYDNYMGSLQQINNKKENVIDFFVDCRLQPQLELAKSSGKIDGGGLHKFDQLIDKLPQLLVGEKPSLIHGDLWSGNFMMGGDGHAALIDPAVAYSHREMELAMTKLFGGFDQQFYNTYLEAFPVEPGLDERLDIYNLYPLLVHVNLFGGGYYNQVLAILNRFV